MGFGPQKIRDRKSGRGLAPAGTCFYVRLPLTAVDTFLGVALKISSGNFYSGM
jgi:hypothetical protein